MATFLSNVIFAVVLLQVCDGSIGVSLSKALDKSGWEALVATTPTISSGAVHILFYNGSINQHAPSTIRAGWNANIRDLSVYMHPCMNTSVYSVQNNVPCGTVKEQFESILDTMTNNNIDFRQYLTSGMVLLSNSTSAAPTRQPTQSPTVASVRHVLQWTKTTNHLHFASGASGAAAASAASDQTENQTKLVDRDGSSSEAI